ncbi:MAG: HD domain-containing protein [candidate division WOR-3 bacterium]|jgi:HD-GYP domain-containing protein (c-di-GMP phosphodiesterase class II)
MHEFAEFREKVSDWENENPECKNSAEELHKRFEVLKEAITNSLPSVEEYVDSVEKRVGQHQKNVAKISEALADYLGLSLKEKLALRAASKLHDVGKICIPSEILNKPGSLTQLEYDIAQFHSYISFRVLSKVRVMEDAARMVLQHHERIDGSGYPQGIRGDKIDIGAKILAVADVLEAMTASQPYRFSHDLKKTLEEILTGRGKQYDPDVVDACMELFERKT